MMIVSNISFVLFISLLLHSVSTLHLDVPPIRQSTSTSPFTCNGEAPGSRIRKEIRSLSSFELRRWRSVMQSLMTERPANAPYSPPPSFWDLLIAVHIVYRAEAHNGAYFLPWHRFFLLFLENHIRETFPDFTLPYWDWSSLSDAPDPALSSLWGSSYIGGSSNPSNLQSGTPIPNGPFAASRGHYLDDHPVRRGFNAGVSGSMRPLVNASTMSSIISSPGTWGDFSDAVETAHNRVHADIGGDMFSTLTSPNDPVFYLHHTFVDKVWWERQRIYGASEYGGDHTFNVNGRNVNFDVRTDFVFQYFNLAVNVTFEQNCVAYEAYNPPRRFSLTLANDEGSAGTDVCEETDMMSRERCRRGEEIIETAASR